MKFGKEFAAQLVPEWAAAYVDYNGLKRILQDIRRFSHPSPPLQPRSTFYRTFSGLHLHTTVDVAGDVEDQVDFCCVVYDLYGREMSVSYEVGHGVI